MQRATFPLFALVAFVLLGASPALAPGGSVLSAASSSGRQSFS